MSHRTSSDHDDLVSASGAARELARYGVKLSESAIKAAATRGELPMTRTVDRGVRLFRVSDLKAFALTRRG
jgi:hypothetical protein